MVCGRRACENLFLLEVQKLISTKAFAGLSSFVLVLAAPVSGVQGGGWTKPPLPKAFSQAVHPIPGLRNGASNKIQLLFALFAMKSDQFKQYCKVPVALTFTEHKYLPAFLHVVAHGRSFFFRVIQ